MVFVETQRAMKTKDVELLVSGCWHNLIGKHCKDCYFYVPRLEEPYDGEAVGDCILGFVRGVLGEVKEMDIIDLMRE